MSETPESPSPDPSASGVLLGERLCREMVDRWRGGERVPAEAYLQRYPQLSDELAFELILTEVILRQEHGEPARQEEFAWRFPHFASRLERHFALQATFAAAGGGDTTAPSLSVRPLVRPVAAEGLSGVPGYEILSELGRGGMGVVYKARDDNLGRLVALKFLPPEYTGDADRLQRLLHEARAASALNHPHICTVHALDQHDGRPFIVMEYIEGMTLQGLLSRRVDLSEVIRLIRQAAQALAAAHAAGVVHRDIKPENIMVRSDGIVKVVDFGLARRLPTLVQPGPPQSSVTQPGAILGTVAYMSPEQARGELTESPSDIFSLGIVLYQLATGQQPFAAESPLEMLHAITTRTPLPAGRVNRAIPASLEGLVEAMLHKDPRLRPSAVEVDAALAAQAAVARQPSVPRIARAIVHREQELAVLRSAWDDAQAGHGGIVSLAGEPGIGKSTLVEDFLEQIVASSFSALIARGHCSERLADSEAYLPVVDALEDLLRCDASGMVGRTMEVVAPAWYARVAPAARGPSARRAPAPAAAPGPPAAAHGAPAERLERATSQPAMLREFTNLIQEITRLEPAVLFLDDVHWADVSTVDLLDHLGRHCQAMRVLVLITYRPTEMLLGPHPLQRVKMELEGRQACRELRLGFWNCNHIQTYLNMVFPDHRLPGDFADLIFARTEGSPLFTVDLLRYLREQGVIASVDKQWSLVREIPDLNRELPGSVRSMIQRKLDQLDENDRSLLSAASVQGCEFDSAVVAGALDREPAEVEERLQTLDRIHGLVRVVREHEFPDGTVTVRYAFVHVLYQQALYHDLTPTRRTACGAALAHALEQHHGERSAVAASELGWLYEVGRDYLSAARQFGRAAQNAASVFAHREAVVLAQRGLRLLKSLPATAERLELELRLQTTLGMQLQITDGFAAPAAKAAYSRAREICRQRAESAPLFPVLWGLWLCSKVRSELAKAQEMADELLALARRLHDPDLALQAHQALGMTAFCRGEAAAAIQHVEQAAALYDPKRHHTHAFLFGQDPGVICTAYGAVALWLLGFPDQALRQSQAAISRSRELSPSSRAVALHFAAMLHQLRRDHEQALQCADASCAISAEHGFSFWMAGGNVLGGWAQAAAGQLDCGLDRLQQGLKDWSATDSVTYQTYYMGLLSETLSSLGRHGEAKAVLQRALDLAEATGERLYEPELRRLQGELALPDRPDIAEQAFRDSLALARHQECRGLELRAAISQVRMSRQQGNTAQDQKVLADLCRGFTEGRQSRDLLDAQALLRTDN